MMATTHAFTGVALAATIATAAPEFALLVAPAALLGGIFPDFDLYTGHRKTLHFPVYYSLLAAVTGAVALLTPSTATVAIAVFALACAVHSVMDAFGGGLELKPWEGTSDRAVYSHYHGRWLEPRRWVRYDGAPEDLALACVLAIPGLIVFDGVVQDLLIAMLAISVCYTAVRKPMVYGAEWVIARTPDAILASVPVRLLPIDDEDAQRLFD